MKKIFSQMTSYVVTASLICAPLLAQAGQKTRGSVRPVPQKYREDFVQMRDFVTPMGYTMRYDHANKRALVYDSTTKKLTMEVPFQSENELRKYSPSNLEGRLLKEMAKVNATVALAGEQAADSAKEIGKATWNTSKKGASVLARSSSAAWTHAYKRLPTESAMFFMAMGAVAAGQLFLDFSQNPVAFQQHLEHQLSPLGVIGFWSFMLTQGIASNVLMSYLGNSKLNFMIPYLGMTVGFFVQSYLSQILADPNVLVCAKSWAGMKPTPRDYELGATENACDAAYEYLIVKKQLWILAPGLASMLLSSAAAAFLQKGAQLGAARMGFMELAILLTPGQTQIKGLRAVIVHGLQITTFVALDAWFNRWVTTAWKNTFDGKALLNTTDDLTSAVNTMKQGEWNGDEKELIEKIKEFKNQMADWRMMNLSSVYEAHSNWSTAIGKMTGTYNASKKFYEDFGDQIRNTQFGLQPMRPLTQIYPLKGITASGLPLDGQEAAAPAAYGALIDGSATPAQSDLYFTFPKNLEGQQIATVKKAAGYIELKLIDPNVKMNDAEVKALKKSLAAINAGIKSFSLERGYFLGKAIYEFNRMRYNMSQSRSQSMDFSEIVATAYQIMGNPDPMLAPGRGYVTTYFEAPMNQEVLHGAEFDHVKHQVGIFAAPTLTDKFVMQMLCGPDANSGEMLTEDKWGFPSTFTPPRLHTSKTDLSVVCNNTYGKLEHADNFYIREVKSSGGNTYRGYLEYIIANAIPGAIGDQDKSNMLEWWNKTTEVQMRKAFDQYSRSYNEIIATMLEAIYRTDKHILNKSPFANGISESIAEQRGVYFRMLSDLLYPSKNTFSLDIGMAKKRVRLHPTLVKVQAEFENLDNLIARIKVVPAGEMPSFEGKVMCEGPVDYVRIESGVDNSAIEEQIQKVKLAISNVAKALGVSAAAAPQSMEAPTLDGILEDIEADAAVPVVEVKQDVTLNKQQSAYANELLEGLDALAQEFSTYARIANAVTWDKVQHTKESGDEKAAWLKKIQQMKSRLTPGG